MRPLRETIAGSAAMMGRTAMRRLLWYFGVFGFFFYASGQRLIATGGDGVISVLLSSLLAAVMFTAVHSYLFSSGSDV